MSVNNLRKDTEEVDNYYSNLSVIFICLLLP